MCSLISLVISLSVTFLIAMLVAVYIYIPRKTNDVQNVQGAVPAQIVKAKHPPQAIIKFGLGVLNLLSIPSVAVRKVSSWYYKNKFERSFKGKTFERPSDDYVIPTGKDSSVATMGAKATAASAYNAAAFGYGLSSFPERCAPKKVIYAENEKQVMDTVKLAYDTNIALALRTGGHQYGCFNSTTGDNIQLDVRFAFREEPVYDKKTNVIKVAVGWMVKDLSAWMRKLKRGNARGDVGCFVPHGECGTVHIGGHMQSGGYSPFCGRSWGYFVDHIVAFTIILAPNAASNNQATKLRVIKPLGCTDPNSRNSMLYKAVLGGCPGAYGVLCSCEFTPLWDADYPYSRTQMWAAPYTSENLKTFLSIVTKFNDQQTSLPDDYNINTGTLAGNPLALADRNSSIDARMCARHPAVTGNRQPSVSRVIMLTATYANLAGANQSAGEAKQAKLFFESIDETLGGAAGSKARTLELMSAENVRDVLLDSTLLPWLLPRLELVHPPEHVPMSQGAAATTFNERTQNNPFCMAVYLSANPRLCTKDFLKFSVDTCDEGHKIEGGWPDYQWLVMGGKMNRKQNNLVPFRKAGLMLFLYMHYDTVINGNDVCRPKEESEALIEKMTKRLLGSEANNWQDGFMKTNWQMVAFPNKKHNIDKEWRVFFDDEETYKYALNVKRVIDPTDVFTPNTMVVGASGKYGTTKLDGQV